MFGWPWPSNKVTVIEEINFCAHCLANFWILIRMKFSMLPQPVSLFKLIPKLFCKIYIQGWELYLRYIFNSGQCWDTGELICFKLCVILDMTKFDSMIPVCMTLTFIQGRKAAGQLELVLSVCSKVAWSYQNVCDVYIREMTAEMSYKYGEHGSFEHLLFLFIQP